MTAGRAQRAPPIGRRLSICPTTTAVCWNGGREASRLSRLGSREQVRDARFKRLAQSIDSLAEKDESFLRQAGEIAALRRTAAAGLYAICSGFVDSLNHLLS